MEIGQPTGYTHHNIITLQGIRDTWLYPIPANYTRDAIISWLMRLSHGHYYCCVSLFNCNRRNDQDDYLKIPTYARN